VCKGACGYLQDIGRIHGFQSGGTPPMLLLFHVVI